MLCCPPLQAVTEQCCLHVADASWLPDVLQRGGDSDHRALAAAVELSLRSNHPVSRAMARSGHAAGNQLPHIEIREFKAIPGALT
jgi:cation transport ATPase